MTEEELEKSPVIRMAGSDGETYEATADMASEMAAAARDEGVELKPFLKTKDAAGNVHEISPFDDAALKEAQDRGDERHFEGNVEEDYFSADALKAGAARFAIGLVNPWDWIRGIGTAAGTVARGLAKGTVGTAIKALRGATYLGESITNAITGDDNHDLSDAIGKVDKGFDAVVDFLTPDLFKITGEYDGVEGAEEAAGKVRNVAEMVANLKGIGALTKGMAAAQVAKGVNAATAAREGHVITGALFGLGKYGEVASDPNGPGGARQQAAALAAGAADAVIFGLWNPFKISAKHAAELKPFMEQTRKEVTKRVLLKLGQMAESGAAMATVEGVRQGAEQLAGIGQEGKGTWGDRSWEDSLKEIGSQFIVGSAFAAMEVVEGLPERVAHWRARRAQDPNGQMKVAMNYQVEKARKTLCPARHQQAVYAYSRFLKQGNRAESFKEGLSFGEDVRRVNEDGSVVFDDGSVWRLDPTRNGATITISDGTILDAKTGDLLGYRARQESGERTGTSPRTPEEGADEGKAGTEARHPEDREARHSDERAASNAMVLLQQIDEGKLPIVQFDIAAIEGRAPTENGNEIGEWDPEKASPIVVLEDLEGNLRALTGGKRLAMAGASGAEKINAVVVKEADGWTAEMADGLGAIENMRQGNATLRNVVAACETLGAEQVQEIAGWHQAKGSQEFASKMRRGLSVAQKGGAELKAALAEGTVGEDFAYNAAQVLSMDRVGEGWEAAQKALVDLTGRVGPEELDAVLWGLKRRITPGGAGESGRGIDWGAAIAEERAKYNAKNGAEEGKVDSDLVLIETGEGELKTLGEVEAGTEIAGAEANHPEGMAETAYAAAEGAAGNKAVELQAVSGREGVYTTLAFPDARLKVDGGAKTLGIDGLKIDDFAGANTERAAALVAKVEAFASENGLKIGFYYEDVMEAWRAMREQIKAEGEAAHARSEAEARRNTVVEQLQKSGLASEVVQNAEDFDRLFAELSGEALRKGEEVYGFVDPKTGKVYLNPAFFGTRQGLETSIHEFGHLGVIAAEKVNKPVYDRGMKLATDFLEKPETAGEGPVRAIVDFILNDRVYSGQSREVQAQELLAQLIGKRGEEALRNEPNKSVVTKIKSWLVEFWNSFGRVLGLGEITPEQAAKMSLEDVADAIRAEMLSGRKYGESFAGVEFAGGGARTATRPRRLKRKLTGRRKAVNEFVREMGGGEDPTNRDVDLLALWVDNGGRLFDALPFEIDTHYSAGKAGVKKSRRSVADEFAESSAFYKGLNQAQRAVYFGTEKLETGSIGEGLKNRLEEAGITRFTREDGTVDFEGVISEFERQWSNYERGESFAKERREAEASGVMFSRSGIFTGSSADYANRSRQGGKDDGPSVKKIGSGEGSQVYGWGLYGSTERGVAERYARNGRGAGAKDWTKEGKNPRDLSDIEGAAASYLKGTGSKQAAIDRLENDIEYWSGKNEYEANDLRQILAEIKQHGDEYREQHENVYEQTWFTNREPGDESHLLKWYEDLPKEQVDWIAQEFAKEGFFVASFSKLKGWTVLDRASGKKLSVWDKRESGETYEAIASFLGTPQAASEFLARAGIDGVKYPVDSYGKTVKDGDEAGWNYVAFSDEHIRVDHKWTDGQLLFSRGKDIALSKLGDGKQRYYEVKFEDAVDKIVKNKKPVSRDHVFVGETPKPFADIGFAKLPVMMGQGHVISCYFGEGEGVEGKHLHKLKGNLKLLPKALEKPLMIITSESSPSDSVVAILKMKDNTGASVIVPVKMSGVGRAGAEKLDAHIALTMFGKKNAWKSLVAKAIEKEANGEVGVFYINGAESKTILERLGEKAKGLGVAGLQSPGETKTHRNPENGSSGLQSPSASISQGTLHSIADEGSPVKGGIVSQTATRQFKNWFGGSKVVDANGEPLAVYHATNNDEATSVWDERTKQYLTSHKPFTIFKRKVDGLRNNGHFFTSDRSNAEGYGNTTYACYLNIRNPLVIDCNGSDYSAIKHDGRVLDTYEWAQWAEKNGHDGVIFKNVRDGVDYGAMQKPSDEYVVFSSNQIKSATDNIGTFDPGNPDVRFSRGSGGRGGRAPEVEYVKLTRVADDAGVGELTPGGIAASEELSRTAPTPLTARGTRYVALPLSEMNALARYLTGHATPAEMSTRLRQGYGGQAGKVSLKYRKLVIAADVLGTIDKTDLAAEKAMLKQHGFFAHEDPAWTANHSPAEVRRERERSEEALSSRLEKLADRRTRGVEAGGQAAGRKVFCDQLAKIVMQMPHGQPGVLGQMQTVGGAIEKRVKGSDAEAEAFLDWMHGGPPQAARSVQERKAGMFAAFLMMPKEMEARAKGWYDAIRSTIAGDQKLADAFREMTARSMTAQGFGHLQAEIVKMQDVQTEAAIKKLRAEGEAPIKAGSAKDAAKETIVLSCDDRMGAAMVRVDAKLRMYQEAQKLAMKLAKTPAEKALIKQQTDIFMGEIAQAKNQVELSRTAWERGHNNEDARYLWRMVDLLNEATERDGLRTLDLSLYLDQQRVIETKGLSGARGESTRQAQLVLDAMRKRLGADFAKVEAFAAKFRAIHEQELLDDPVLERVLGKGTADYWRSQTHYVTTKRQFSPEELAEIEAARAAVRASGAAGGDDVVGEMFKFTQSAGKGSGEKMATAKLKGSFADKQEVMSATFEKVAAIKKFLRRSEYVIELRDLLLKAKVEGVHDYAAGKSEFPQNKRYGSISYMENGQRRTLVVPKEIADGFKAQGDYNNAALKLCGTVNNFARQLWIDWNPVYWQRNIGRNAGSIEMNMPGMKESVIKRGARFVFPGLAPVTEIAMTHLVRHLPEKMSLPLRKIWGEHTALFYAPKAKRMAMWLTDHNKMQHQLWEAEKRGDLGKVQQMLEDQRDMLDALKANMLVGGSAGKMGGTTGFLDDSVRTLGKTMMRERQEFAAKSKVRRALDAVNIFKKNAEQQVFEDVLAKFSAYLHDRTQFGTGNNRTAAESGLVVKKNVSIGEGERKGQATRTIQALFQPFWNMVEKGVVRNVKAYGDRPGETFQKAAWRIAPMILHGLVGSGAVAAWILKSNGGDEEKAKSGPMGDIYRYARDMQRAYQNCSNYVRENYHVTPLMTDGYTSIVLGMPLTDEERLLKPIAQFVTDVAAVAAGTKESLDVAKAAFDATYGVVAPDFKLAGALPTLLDDTVHALWENPKDYYTGGQKYDNDLWLLRNDSWGMRGKFLAAMGKRLWNDFGGRNVMPVDRAGVDNGIGRAPGWVSRMVNDIPVVSPILRSFIKVQVGSPKRDADEIVEADNRRRAACRIHAKELFEMARREKRDISMDRERYEGLLQKWQQSSERLSYEDLAYIESHYINAWNAYEGAQYRADGEREKYRAKAEKLGLDAAHLWLDFD